MSVLVRLWSQEELERASTGEDLWLTTLLLNKHSFFPNEMRAFNRIPEEFRHEYRVWFVNDEEPIMVRAATNEALRMFLRAEYQPGSVEEIVEVVTTYRDVELE